MAATAKPPQLIYMWPYSFDVKYIELNFDVVAAESCPLCVCWAIYLWGEYLLSLWMFFAFCVHLGSSRCWSGHFRAAARPLWTGPFWSGPRSSWSQGAVFSLGYLISWKPALWKQTSNVCYFIILHDLECTQWWFATERSWRFWRIRTPPSQRCCRRAAVPLTLFSHSFQFAWKWNCRTNECFKVNKQDVCQWSTKQTFCKMVFKPHTEILRSVWSRIITMTLWNYKCVNLSICPNIYFLWFSSCHKPNRISVSTNVVIIMQHRRIPVSSASRFWYIRLFVSNFLMTKPKDIIDACLNVELYSSLS